MIRILWKSTAESNRTPFVDGLPLKQNYSRRRTHKAAWRHRQTDRRFETQCDTSLAYVVRAGCDERVYVWPILSTNKNLYRTVTDKYYYSMCHYLLLTSLSFNQVRFVNMVSCSFSHGSITGLFLNTWLIKPWLIPIQTILDP